MEQLFNCLKQIPENRAWKHNRSQRWAEQRLSPPSMARYMEQESKLAGGGGYPVKVVIMPGDEV